MQTIARANRVFHHKLNGLIVDYIGIFRNLQRALALYAAPVDGSSLPDTFWHIKSAKESTIVRSACEKARNVSS